MEPVLVGRARELRLLADRFDAALAGRGSLVLVAGEAGIGKTALVERLTRSVHGVPVLTGRSVPDEGAPALWPWRRLLASAAQPGARPSSGEGGDGVRPPAAGLHPGLLDLEPATAAAAARFTAFDRTVSALRAAATTAGLLLILEDLHWADTPSLLLLRHLAGEIAGTRILAVGTFRDPHGAAPVAPVLAELTAMSIVECVRPAPLTTADVAGLLAGQADPGWPGYLHARTGGNPLYLRELSRALAQDGVLDGPPRNVPLPTELRRLIGYRLSRLTPHCRELLEACSAIGDEVDAAVLAAVSDADPAGLAEAVAAGVLAEDPADPAVLRFSHAIVREATYDGLGRAGRLDLHRRIADALGDDRPGERARHRVRAAVDPASRREAALACRYAAEAAAGRRLVDEAHRWYTRSLEFWPGDDGRAGLLVDAATAGYGAGLIAEAVRHCTAAADLAAATGRPDLLAAAALVVRGVGDPSVNATIVRLCERARAVVPADDVTTHARLLAQQAYATAEVTGPRAAEPLAAEALTLAERSGDRDALVAALHARHQVLVPPDAVAERLALGARLKELDPPAEALLWAHMWRVEAQLQLGATGPLDTECRELTELADRLGWPLVRWYDLRVRAARAVLAGRFDEAWRLARQSRDVALRTQDRSTHTLYYPQAQDIAGLTGQFDELPVDEMADLAEVNPMPIVWSGICRYLWRAGDHERALPLYERCRAMLTTLPYDLRRMPVIAVLAEVAADRRDTDTVAFCLEALLPYTAYYLYSASGVYGAIARMTGNLAAALDRLDEADRLLGQAVVMETRVAAPPFQALAQLDHAAVLVRRDGSGDLDRARRLVERGGHTARVLGMAPAAARAATLAAELGTAARRAGPALTTREREIAALVAEGLANRAIADKLVLSERTVETHVRSILTKLGLSNRTQVAAWTLRRD